MGMLVSRCVRRSRLVQELAEDWQINHREAMFARDLDELLAECVDLGRLLSHCWKQMFNLLFSEQIDDVDRAGKSLLSATERSLTVFDKVKGFLAAAKQRGFEIDGDGSFIETVSVVGELKTEMIRQWPSIDDGMMRESLLCYERGEYQSTEELLHGLQDKGSKIDSR